MENNLETGNGGAPTTAGRPSNKRLQQTQAQVDEVVGIMKVNVEKVLERDQKLSQLDDRADALQEGASQFEKSAATLKQIVKLIFYILACLCTLPRYCFYHSVLFFFSLLHIIHERKKMTYNPNVIPVTDNTHLFKARIKMIRAKDKEDSEKEKGEKTNNSKNNKLSLYINEAKEILKHITLLKTLALNNRYSYIASSGFYFPVSGKDVVKMSFDEKQRKKLDAASDDGLEDCQKLIENFGKQINADSFLKNIEKEMIENIFVSMDSYLNTVRREIMEMREKYNEKAKRAKFLGCYSNFVKMDQDGYRKAFKDINEKYSQSDNILIVPENKIRFRKTAKEDKPLKKNNYYLDEDNKVEDEENSEIPQQVLKEQEKFYQKLTNKNEEIEVLSRQFAEIEKLQHKFLEKALEQEKNIEVIHEKVELTEVNLKVANNFIKNALENTATKRVIYMFCIIVLTLSLLFLDWYNP
uniref:Coiled-coil domain-containing protein 25 n=1 Tax=Strongyloides stercoralis TaxID=6248 RepID=A0AAF5CSH5_STRER